MTEPEIRLAPVEGWRAYSLGILATDVIGWYWYETYNPYLALCLLTRDGKPPVPKDVQRLIQSGRQVSLPHPSQLKAGETFFDHLWGPILVGRLLQPWWGPRLRAACVLPKQTYLLNVAAAPEDEPAQVQERTWASQHLKAGTCSCGIYLLRAPRQEWTDLAYTYARCRGWGYVVEHEGGWRCEQVEILELYVPSLILRIAPAYERLLERYPVPIKPVALLQLEYPAVIDFPR